MSIIDEVLSRLGFEVPVQDMRQGPFRTAVVTPNCGL